MLRETLLIDRGLTAALAAPRDYLACTHAAFLDLAGGVYELPDVGHVDGTTGVFHVKAASRRGPKPFVAVKVNANFPDNPSRHALPTIQGFVALLDADDGRLLALMDSTEITARRTAAATALAARHLARPDSAVLGIVGCGEQARCHIDALLDLFPLQRVRLCDPRELAANALIERIAGRLEAIRVPDPRAAALGADIVVTLTPSRDPLLDLDDVAPGTFVAGVGADNPSKNELSAGLLRASRVVVDRLAQAVTIGDLHHAVRLGAMRAEQVYCELEDLVAGRRDGRRNASERYVFDSTGVAALDLAAAEMLYERAQAARGVPTITFNDVPD
jgi:ornithine cyclodeaminase/alanine dehydrogenase-like protein (mu-crystallin family)